MVLGPGVGRGAQLSQARPAALGARRSIARPRRAAPLSTDHSSFALSAPNAKLFQVFGILIAMQNPTKLPSERLPYRTAMLPSLTRYQLCYTGNRGAKKKRKNQTKSKRETKDQKKRHLKFKGKRRTTRLLTRGTAPRAPSPTTSATAATPPSTHPPIQPRPHAQPRFTWTHTSR